MKRDNPDALAWLDKPVRERLSAGNLIGCAVINMLLVALCFYLFVAGQLRDLFWLW